MESFSPKNSNELLNNQDIDINEDINDIGLPKSSLQSFLKGFLSDKKIRGDKNIVPMLDKISRLYVYHISSLGAKICTDCGKKTLNLEHVFEALKTLKFDEHIEKLVKDVKDINNGEIDTLKYDQLEEEQKKENANLKQLINKKKKRGGRKKKYFENEDERAKMKAEQEKMFEEARNDMNRQQENDMYGNLEGINNENDDDNEDEKDKINILDENDGKINEKKEEKDKYSNLDNKLFLNNDEDEDGDINFD
jgi:hypothetical protein